MEIEDAFTEEAINVTGTNLEGEPEAALRDVIQRIYATNEIDHIEAHIRVSMLCFVAGRTYQSDLNADPTILIPMTPEEIPEYIAWRIERGAT